MGAESLHFCGAEKGVSEAKLLEQHTAGSGPPSVNKSQMGMDYLCWIVQTVGWRSTATRYEHRRKTGLSYDAHS